jgi:hypothetical protein
VFVGATLLALNNLNLFCVVTLSKPYVILFIISLFDK